jgi:hypothetical protein
MWETGSPGSERPFFPKVRARALTVTPTGEPVTLHYISVDKSKQLLSRQRWWGAYKLEIVLPVR